MKTVKSNANGESQVVSITAASLTFAGGVATFTATAAHNLSTDDSVFIRGANQENYNGKFTITVTGATTFTFVPNGVSAGFNPVTPATGTITARLNLPTTEYDPFALIDRGNRLIVRLAQIQSGWRQLDVTLAAGDTPQQFSANSIVCSRAIVKADSTNTDTVKIGPNDTPTWETLAAGDEYLIECPAGKSFDLSAWYFNSATISQKISILYV